MKYFWLLAFLMISVVFSGCIGSGSCNQFNIDSFELTAGINIPKVTDVDCFENDTLRISIFYIDIENASFLSRYKNMTGYVNEYKMERLEVKSSLPLEGVGLLPKGLRFDCDTFYETSGTTKSGRYWKYMVCKEKKLLITEMVTK